MTVSNSIRVKPRVGRRVRFDIRGGGLELRL
jgi:hypothetical protein